MRLPGLNIHVLDSLVQNVPMELTTKFAPVISLNHVRPKRQSRESVIYKLDGCSLINLLKDLQNPETRAVIDGGILIVSFSRSFYSFQKFHVNLHSMPWFWLLISSPASFVGFIALVLWKTIELKSFEDSKNTGFADLNIVISPKIHRNLIWTKMIGLPKAAWPKFQSSSLSG